MPTHESTPPMLSAPSTWPRCPSTAWASEPCGSPPMVSGGCPTAQPRDLVREAVRLGVDFIDTAVAHGPEVSERLIADALHPYSEDE